MKAKIIKFSDIAKDKNFILSPSYYLNKENSNKETKLIIEGKEFEIIKYEGDVEDKWFVGELGLVITKKVAPHDFLPTKTKKGDIIWDGASSGKEENQLETLITLTKANIDYWKKVISGLDLKDSNYAVRLIRCEARLDRAKHGLNKLEELRGKDSGKNQN